MAFRIGYAGLGNMGTAVFLNLCKHARAAGLAPPTAWNRSPAKYDALKADTSTEGVHWAASLEDVVSRSNVIFTCLLNEVAAESVYAQLLGAVKQGDNVVFVDQSSIKPTLSIKLEEQARAAGASYIAAPVFGRPDAAAAGKLIQVVAGDAAAKEFVKPLLMNVIARHVIDAGDEVAKGTSLKLLGNGLILSLMEALGETYALADSIGLDSAVFQEFINEFFPTPSYKAYGGKIQTGNFDGTGGFRVEGGLKDCNNMLTLGADLGHPVELPTIALAKQHLERAAELGGKDQDWSAMAIALREKAGLPPYKAGKP